jgi:hypothetical protein
MSNSIVDDGSRRKVPISRRGAIGRLFGLGAGAVAAAAVPAPVQAAQVATVLPSWLTADPELASLFERIALAQPTNPRVAFRDREFLRSYADLLEHWRGDHSSSAPPRPMLVEPIPEWLVGQPDWLVASLERLARAIPRAAATRDAFKETERYLTGAAYADWLAGAVERSADPEWINIVFSYRQGSRGAPMQAAPAPRPKLVDDARVATARIRRLTANERRRARRWIARQPTGRHFPLIRLRPGRRAGRWAEDVDYIDVARPAEGPMRGCPPFELVAGVVANIGIRVGEPIMYAPLCSHQGDARNSMMELDGVLVNW